MVGGGLPDKDPDDGRVDGEEADIEVIEGLGERVGVERISSPFGLDIVTLPLSSGGDGEVLGTFGLGMVEEVGVPQAL